MAFKERLQRQLVAARDLSEGLLRDFRSPEDWTRQIHACSNHALWFAGHMGHVDNFFISLLVPEKAYESPDFATRFGMGSQPSSNPADYPPVEEVLAYMRERRALLLSILDQIPDQELGERLPAGTPDFLSDKGSVFEMAIWHEGVHSGQLSVARRALGHGPLRG